MKILGVTFAPLCIPLHRRLETLSVCVSFFLMIILPFASIVFSIYLCFTKYWWITAAYAIWIFVDKDTPEIGGRINTWVRSCPIFQYTTNYFPIRAKVVPGFKLDPKVNYLGAWFPHGFLPIGIITGLTTGYGEEFANHTIHSMTINSNFYLPFYRDFILSLGMLKASPKSVSYMLNYPGGSKIILLSVGGSHEALYFKSGEYRIILKNRKGFIKLALKNGSPVIPMLSFGGNDPWNQIIFKNDSLIRRFQIWVREKTNITLAIFVGRGIFQYSIGILPFRKPINVVVGLPLEFGKVENPTQTEIDEAHQKFVDALISIFEEYKYMYEEDPQSCKLIIE